MCFSATASFISAGITLGIGIVSVSRTTRAQELPLAATPIFFGLQQAVEGLLWLNFSQGSVGADFTALTFLFVFFAEVFWPVYSPIAVLLVESDVTRRRLLFGCLAVGVTVSAYLLWSALVGSNQAVTMGGHIIYLTGLKYSQIVAVPYVIATTLPLLLSSHRPVVVLGTIVLVGLGVAYMFYWDAVVSVWCFFAAVGSVVILAHFERARRRQIRLAYRT